MNCRECKNFKINPQKKNIGHCKGTIVPADRPASECPQKSFQRRIEPWLVGKYDRYFKRLKNNVAIYFEDKYDPGLFTLHDKSHCASVEKMEKVLVTKSFIDFSALERFLLSCAAWTHDLGMNPRIAKEYFSEMLSKEKTIKEISKLRRDEHHNISCWFIQKNCLDLFGIDPKNNNNEDVIENFNSFSWALSSIIQFHRKSENISTCEETTSIRGEIIRLKLLAAILRLADTLHKDSSRFDHGSYAMIKLANFGRMSRLHWLKSFVVSNIHLGEHEQTISISLKLPDYKHFEILQAELEEDKVTLEKLAKDWDEKIRNLQYVISTDIEADLVIVNSIFAKYKMPTYVRIHIDVAYIRGFSKDFYSDIKSVLSELDIIFSPNTSKVIGRSLDSLAAFASGNFDDFKTFKDQFTQLLDYLSEIKNDRPCHAGLSRIIDLVEKIQKTDCENVQSIKKQIKAVVETIKKFREDAKNKINGKEDLISKQTTDIFVIGFSSTILGLLTSYGTSFLSQERRIEVHVMECAPKRRLVHNNVIEYCDGAHYAIEIGKLGYYTTHLIPDIGFATVLDKIRHCNGDRPLSENVIVLFGANGIDESTGDCGHTSGHLSAAIIAKEFDVPVKIIADSFKIGPIKFDHTQRRKGDWLVTQENIVKDLGQAHVKLTNMREDRIPIAYISQIITEEGELTLKEETDIPGRIKVLSKNIDSLMQQLSKDIQDNLMQ